MDLHKGFPCTSASKESPCNTGDPGLIPGLGRPPGEETATYSNILAWRVPWTEEPGRLPVHGVARVGHDLATNPPQRKKQDALQNLKHVRVLTKINPEVPAYSYPRKKENQSLSHTLSFLTPDF